MSRRGPPALKSDRPYGVAVDRQWHEVGGTDGAERLEYRSTSGDAGSRLQAHLHAAVAFFSKNQVMFGFGKLTQVSETFKTESELLR